MLEDFDRLDVEELYRLVKERYSASRPEGFDLMLWGDLHTLFEPDEDDEIWKDQHEYKLLSWRLYDFCAKSGVPRCEEEIRVDHKSNRRIELLRFIRSKCRSEEMFESSQSSEEED
ncbi:hypothetical protein Tco_1107659 [Tanacetum coccineum]